MAIKSPGKKVIPPKTQQSKTVDPSPVHHGHVVNAMDSLDAKLKDIAMMDKNLAAQNSVVNDLRDGYQEALDARAQMLASRAALLSEINTAIAATKSSLDTLSSNINQPLPVADSGMIVVPTSSQEEK